MTTTVQLNLQEAAAHAKRYLAWREQALWLGREKWIRGAMRHTLWQRLLRKPPRTREQARAYLEAGGPFTAYGLIGLSGGAHAEVAQAVSAAAARTADRDATAFVEAHVYSAWLRAPSVTQPENNK